MKRRDFLSAPVALVGLGLAAGGERVAQAAGITSSASFAVLRLSGSALETDAFGNWQEYWPQVPSTLTRGRVVVHGFVRGTGATLGPVDIESVFFGAEGKVNTALVYTVSDTLAGSGSGAIGFYVQAPQFGGFVVTSRSVARTGTKARSSADAAPSVMTLGDGNGRLAPGLYVMVHKAGSKGFDASQYVYTGYNDRPLMLRNGTRPDTDYLAFSVEAV